MPAKRVREDGSSSSSSSSKSRKDESKVYVDLQKEYVTRVTQASQSLMEVAMKEVKEIDIETEDFGASDLNLERLHNLMKYSSPEDLSNVNFVQFIKRTMPKTSPEALITMGKITELFILDLALKAWHAKELETDTLEKAASPHELTAMEVLRAIKTNEEFDMLGPTSAFNWTVQKQTITDAMTRNIPVGPPGSEERVKPIPVDPPQASSHGKSTAKSVTKSTTKVTTPKVTTLKLTKRQMQQQQQASSTQGADATPLGRKK